MPIGRLHVLTDFHFQQRFSHADLARLALAGGADTIQFRQKIGSVRDLLAGLRPTVTACREAEVPLLVDDHLTLALAVEADGVHLGQSDLPIAEARAVLDRCPGHTRLLGATATTVAQAREAEAAGADYIGFGPVFATQSKANPAPVKGLAGLEAVCDAVQIPVIAIAGITPERVRLVLGAGAHGVAVMTAISTAEDPRTATAAFRDAIAQWR
ncbi:MAG: thiamine phosphate synthase [Rhodothermaceae bacterium]|nr:thiamine phosphate synthase [Rhodothermaceae bacterium]